jgi:hypothetical protein
LTPILLWSSFELTNILRHQEGREALTRTSENPLGAKFRELAFHALR